MLTRADRRAEIAAHNVANVTTAGYKSRLSFERLVRAGSAEPEDYPADSNAIDWSQGKLVPSKNASDIAIAGDGFFAVRSSEQIYYTRDGQFTRDADGRLVTAAGAVLQGAGGDVQLGASPYTIGADGAITQDGKVADRILVVAFKDRSALTPRGDGTYSDPAGLASEVASPNLVQGAVEQSNSTNATEMLSLMASLRSAESGQRVAQLYDDLMAQAATGFGQSQG